MFNVYTVWAKIIVLAMQFKNKSYPCGCVICNIYVSSFTVILVLPGVIIGSNVYKHFFADFINVVSTSYL